MVYLTLFLSLFLQSCFSSKDKGEAAGGGGSGGNSEVINLSYAVSDLELQVGEFFQLALEGHDFSRFPVSICRVIPSLPPGLSLNSRTCEIVGTPELASNRQVYRVIAVIGTRNIRTEIRLQVRTHLPQLKYSEEDQKLVIGQESKVVPSLFDLGDGSSAHCSIEPKLPRGVKIELETCAISGIALQSMESKAYTVKLNNGKHTVSTKVQISIPRLRSEDFDSPQDPLTSSRFYKVHALAADSNYLAVIDSQGVKFVSGKNPYSLGLIRSFITTAYGAPQTLISVGNYVYIASNIGQLLIFDWSDRANPRLANTFELPSPNHYYDLSSNGVDTLFVANSASRHLAIVSISELNQPQLIQTFALESMATGVTYQNGYVYVASFSTNEIYILSHNEENQKWEEIKRVPSLTHPSRLASSDKYLLAHRYNHSELQVYSLEESSSQPRQIATITLDQPIGIFSRTIILDDYLLIGQNDALSVWDISDKGQIREVKKIILRDPNGDQFFGLNGMNLFRNDSSLVYIGSSFDSHIRWTQTLPMIRDTLQTGPHP